MKTRKSVRSTTHVLSDSGYEVHKITKHGKNVLCGNEYDKKDEELKDLISKLNMRLHILSKYNVSLENCDTLTLIEYFKENPDKLNDIIVGLRGYKIQKILGK